MKTAMYVLFTTLAIYVVTILAYYTADRAFLDYQPVMVIALAQEDHVINDDLAGPPIHSTDYLIYVGKYHEPTSKEMYEAARSGQVLGAWTRFTKHIVTKKVRKRKDP